MVYPDEPYKYKAFGLTIESSIYLPELSACGFNHLPDVSIVKDTALPNVGDDPEGRSYYQTFNHVKFLLKLHNIASFLIESGNKITVCPDMTVPEQELRLYLLGSALGALFLQRGLLPIHGSAVEKDGRAYVFSGPSGAGKSTLAALMIRNGFNFLTDDVALVAIDQNGQAVVQAAYPQQKLWQDMAVNLDYQVDNLDKILDSEDKFAIRVPDAYREDAIPLSTIYELHTVNEANPSIVPTRGIRSLEVILRNIYRYEFIEALDRLEGCFKQCSAIASKIKVHRVNRPQAWQNPDLLADIICADITQRES